MPSRITTCAILDSYHAHGSMALSWLSLHLDLQHDHQGCSENTIVGERELHQDADGVGSIIGKIEIDVCICEAPIGIVPGAALRGWHAKCARAWADKGWQARRAWAGRGWQARRAWAVSLCGPTALRHRVVCHARGMCCRTPISHIQSTSAR